MTVASTHHKTLITFRLARRVADEVREIAARDDEAVAATLRRLVKSGLTQERRSIDEAAQ